MKDKLVKVIRTGVFMAIVPVVFIFFNDKKTCIEGYASLL